MSVPLLALFDWPYHSSTILRLGADDLSCAESTTLLEALAAKNRTSLRGAERDSGFLSALRACRLRFRAHLGGSAASTTAFSALGLASFASLWFVLETLVGEKHLLAGSKNKFSAAFRALQHPVVVFHEPLSPCPSQGGGWVRFARRAKCCG
jgi:hypothetical protein